MTFSPLNWFSTFATTLAPLRKGAPKETLSPSPAARTFSNVTSLPSSAPSSFSTSSLSPTETRYCLPPVLMTAYAISLRRSFGSEPSRAGARGGELGTGGEVGQDFFEKVRSGLGLERQRKKDFGLRVDGSSGAAHSRRHYEPLVVERDAGYLHSGLGIREERHEAQALRLRVYG